MPWGFGGTDIASDEVALKVLDAYVAKLEYAELDTYGLNGFYGTSMQLIHSTY